jgi:hypothetical protein
MKRSKYLRIYRCICSPSFRLAEFCQVPHKFLKFSMFPYFSNDLPTHRMTSPSSDASLVLRPRFGGDWTLAGSALRVLHDPNAPHLSPYLVPWRR